jgi:hypothetical protein
LNASVAKAFLLKKLGWLSLPERSFSQAGDLFWLCTTSKLGTCNLGFQQRQAPTGNVRSAPILSDNQYYVK